MSEVDQLWIDGCRRESGRDRELQVSEPPPGGRRHLRERKVCESSAECINKQSKVWQKAI